MIEIIEDKPVTAPIVPSERTAAKMYEDNWSEVWLFLNEIVSTLNPEEFEELFSCTTLDALVHLLDYPTAKERYDNYVKMFNLNPGDLVMNNSSVRGVVIKKREHGNYSVLTSAGTVQVWSPMQIVKHLGYTDKVESLLKSIGDTVDTRSDN